MLGLSARKPAQDIPSVIITKAALILLSMDKINCSFTSHLGMVPIVNRRCLTATVY